ncbi:phosphotyrosyl phosphate activator protein [Strigomonas culicis]|nr:phosphotyrosyl phosphate activator protein [Strigomonas culicis]|eukprot:EPY37118.1 phosphotyrosyl phosphate activator protein [Strigomonas culicis]
MATQRFGNRAKRIWHRQMEAGLAPRLRVLAGLLLGGSAEQQSVQELADELAAYMKDSFGNPVRLDYGTGHELHFFIVMVICLQCLGDDGGALVLPSPPPAAEAAALSEGSLPSHYLRERARHVPAPADIALPGPVAPTAMAARCDLRQQFVFFVFEQGYLRLMRRLQRHYCLEPAGSHGVWGLDDYHHIPYILGAAQLIGREQPHTLRLHREPPATADAIDEVHEEAILTKHICERPKVLQHKGRYLYFDMVDWILTNKIGPFHEHSNMLYNISGVAYWEKIYGGMLKMYAAEVLAKFNVTQHLLFGRHLPWNTKKVE